jgi:hypothetical protein
MVILYILFTICTVLGLVYGVFLMRKAALAIEMQIKFYEKINWRMEPISMEAEIRNTRNMGKFLIALTIVTVLIMIVEAVYCITL